MTVESEHEQDSGEVSAAGGLLKQAREGDLAALEALLERNGVRLRGRLNQRLGRALREKLNPSDILQSTYLQIVGSIADFEGATEKDFSNWIVRILENTIRTRARYYSTRKRTADQAAVEDVDLHDPPADISTPSQTAAVGEELQRIARAMTSLPRDYVRILTLHMDAERTHRESGEMMGRTEGASRVLLARARAALFVELGKARKESK